jgi:hypothetical protein
MLGPFLERGLSVWLILAVALPGWNGHVCRCASRHQKAASAAPLRPCCAKRLAQSGKSSEGTEIQSRCCCDQVRWSQTVVKIVPAREFDPLPAWESMPEALATDPSPIRFPAAVRTASPCAWPSSPGSSARIALCRWQI